MKEIENLIKDYQESLDNEARARTLIYLSDHIEICGIKLRHINLLDLIYFRSQNNGIFSSSVNYDGLIEFFYRLRKDISLTRQNILQIISQFTLERIITEIYDYVQFSLFDLDIGISNDSNGTNYVSESIPFTSWPAGIIFMLMSETTLTRNEILNLPLIEISQYIRLVRKKYNPKAYFPSRSDEIKLKLIDRLQKFSNEE